MTSLFKQVFKSLRHSILELTGLIFIFFIVVFTIFSSLFMFFNIDYSINDLKTQSNASDVVLTKKYSVSTPIYKYKVKVLTDPNQPPSPTNPYKEVIPAPIEKSSFVSGYKFDSTLPTQDAAGFSNNVIFPYYTDDFKNVDVNSIDKVGTAPYDDKYLSRYTNRKKGILRANPTNTSILGSAMPQDIKQNRPKTWTGIGWQMKSPQNNTIYFDPINLVFDSDSTTPKILGYFNNGVIKQQTTMHYGLYQPDNSVLNPLITNGVVKPPALNIIQSRPINVDWNVDENILDNLTFHSELFSLLKSNTVTEIIDYYNVYLDTSSLVGIDKYIYDRVKDILEDPTINDPINPNFVHKDFLQSLLGVEVPVRQNWIESVKNEPQSQLKTDIEIIELFLRNNAQDLSRTYSTFVENYRDEFILDYLNTTNNSHEQNNFTVGDSKSFSFFDREVNKNYLITSKDNASKDKLVISSGIAPGSSEKFDYYVDVINKLSSINNNYIVDGFDKLVYDFSKLLVKLNPPNSNSEKNNIENSQSNAGQSNDDLTSLEVEYDKNKPVVKIDMITSIAKELITQYENPNIQYNKNLISKLFSYLSSPNITFDQFRKLSINFDYMEGIYAGSTANSLRFSGLFQQNYQAVVSEKFIEKSDKKIIPLTNKTNPIHSWNHALSINSPKEFDQWLFDLPQEYKIEINSLPFVLTGVGISSDMSYPVNSLEKPIVDPLSDILVYVNNAGYKAISSKLPFVNENTYFSFTIDDKTNINQWVSDLNNNLSSIMNGSTSNVAFKVSAQFNSPLISLRYSFPNIIQFYIQVFSLTVSIILLIIGIYLSFTIIKTWINKNKIQLAIIKANGFSTSKITLCMSLIPMLVAIFGGGLGYLVSILFQQSLFTIISSYIFLSVNFFTFNIGIFIGIILFVFLFSTLFVFINLKMLFKKPIALTINQTIEVKNNQFVNLLNKVQIGFNSNMKLKNQLLFLNIPRTIFYFMSSTMCIFLIGAFSSFSEKLYLSQSLTNSNKQYNYSMDFVTPTEQGGLYKTQKYSELGFTDEAKGIYTMYLTNPYNPAEILLPYDPATLKVLEKVEHPDGTSTWVHKKGDDGRLLYFSNFVLPSETFITWLNTSMDTFRNAVFSKWLMDIEIKSGINLWDLVKTNLSPDIVYKVESQDKIFLDMIASDPDLGDEFKTFALQDPLTKKWSLDAVRVIETKPNIKFNNNFLTFIGKVYGKEHLSNADIKISYGTIPYFNDQIEYYTYVDANVKNSKVNAKYRIYGIQPNSKFMSLKDNDNNPIGHLLNSDQNNIIINNGAAYKYGLNVGDTLTLDVLNSYFRYSEKILDVSLTNNYTFKVVGINSTSFGEEFYISQQKANEITRLNQGTLWLESWLHRKSMPPYAGMPIYNGMFSVEKDPLILSKSLSFYSLFGMYGCFSRFNEKDGVTKNIIVSDYNSVFDIMKTFIPFGGAGYNNAMLNAYNTKHNTNLNHFQIINKIALDTFGTTEYFTIDKISFIKTVSQLWFPENVNPIILSGLENYSLEKELNGSIFLTLETLQTLLMSILLPIIIFVILILTSQMMEEIKKIILIMKLMGYSNRHNIFSALFVFFPIFISSVLFGTLFVWLSMIAFQSFLFSTAAIFVNNFISIPNLMYGFLTLLLIMIINFIYTLFIYRKNNLNSILN